MSSERPFEVIAFRSADFTTFHPICQNPGKQSFLRDCVYIVQRTLLHKRNRMQKRHNQIVPHQIKPKKEHIKKMKARQQV